MKHSEHLLQNISITNVTVSGDTRFDRVWDNAQQPKELPVINPFKDGQKVFIAGSTWPKDEELIINHLLPAYPDWKFIFAPHEIGEDKIKSYWYILPFRKVKLSAFSKITTTQISTTDYTESLIIDNIGMLSSLYQYGEIAFIGGGFGAGIHNTLEAAAFGLPVIFGPNYQKFKEARDIVI